MSGSSQFLDIRTLLVVMILVAGFFGVLLVVFSRIVTAFAGVNWVGAGLLSITLAFALLAGRDVLSPWLGIIAGNLLLTLGLGLMYEGMAAFRGVRTRLRWLTPLALATVALAFHYHVFVVPSLQMRIVWISTVHTLQALALLHATVQGTRPNELRFGQWLVAAPLALLSGYMVLRAGIALGEPEVTSLFSGGAVHAIGFLLFILVTVTSSCGLLWLAVTRMESEMRRQTRTDPLTGALNRRAMDEVSVAEVSRAQRTGHPVSVLIADLDNFKTINDEHGHLVGDEVLRQFATLLGANLRSHDTLVRYGGEEFLVLLPGAGREDAAATAEKLRALTQGQTFHCDALSLRMSVSFGVATLEQPDDDWSHLLRRADAALYGAKDAGRNRVSCAWVVAQPSPGPSREPLPATG